MGVTISITLLYKFLEALKDTTEFEIIYYLIIKANGGLLYLLRVSKFRKGTQ